MTDQDKAELNREYQKLDVHFNSYHAERLVFEFFVKIIESDREKIQALENRIENTDDELWGDRYIDPKSERQEGWNAALNKALRVLRGETEKSNP